MTPTSDQQRILDRIMVTPDGCWIWTGNSADGRYGRITRHHNGRNVTELAHRASYIAFRGPIPAGKQLDHVVCDQGLCACPWHVEPRTSAQNVLRGNAPPAVNARKTRCNQGHPLSGTNLYTDSKGQRHCKQCGRAASFRYYHRRKQAS